MTEQTRNTYVISLDITIVAGSADEAVQQAHIVMAYGTMDSAVSYQTYFVNNIEEV